MKKVFIVLILVCVIFSNVFAVRICDNCGDMTSQNVTDECVLCCGRLKEVTQPKVEDQLLEAADVADVTTVENSPACGANPNCKGKDGYTALHIAAMKSNKEIVKKLLAGGADPNLTEEQRGCNALHIAATQGHPEIVEMLMTYNANPDTRNSLGSDTPLHLLVKFTTTPKRWPFLKTARLLLNYNADPNITNKHGRTPLHEAALRIAPATAHLLLNYNADPNIADNYGNTPYYLAPLSDREFIELFSCFPHADTDKTRFAKWNYNNIFSRKTITAPYHVEF